MPEAKLICPRCKNVFGHIIYQYDSVLRSENIFVDDKYKNTDCVKDNTISCPKCQFAFRIVDILKLITEQLPKT
jgi:uncharacterized protein YbaR (Trm112 family)